MCIICENPCNLWITMWKMLKIPFVACFKDAFCFIFPQKKRDYRFHVVKLTCRKFPKGIYVYRKVSSEFFLIPKGLYVKMLTNHI